MIVKILQKEADLVDCYREMIALKPCLKGISTNKIIKHFS